MNIITLAEISDEVRSILSDLFETILRLEGLLKTIKATDEATRCVFSLEVPHKQSEVAEKK